MTNINDYGETRTDYNGIIEMKMVIYR